MVPTSSLLVKRGSSHISCLLIHFSALVASIPLPPLSKTKTKTKTKPRSQNCTPQHYHHARWTTTLRLPSFHRPETNLPTTSPRITQSRACIPVAGGGSSATTTWNNTSERGTLTKDRMLVTFRNAESASHGPGVSVGI